MLPSCKCKFLQQRCRWIYNCIVQTEWRGTAITSSCDGRHSGSKTDIHICACIFMFGHNAVAICGMCGRERPWSTVALQQQRRALDALFSFSLLTCGHGGQRPACLMKCTAEAKPWLWCLSFLSLWQAHWLESLHEDVYAAASRWPCTDPEVNHVPVHWLWFTSSDGSELKGSGGLRPQITAYCIRAAILATTPPIF